MRNRSTLAAQSEFIMGDVNAKATSSAPPPPPPDSAGGATETPETYLPAEVEEGETTDAAQATAGTEVDEDADASRADNSSEFMVARAARCGGGFADDDGEESVTSTAPRSTTPSMEVGDRVDRTHPTEGSSAFETVTAAAEPSTDDVVATETTAPNEMTALAASAAVEVESLDVPIPKEAVDGGGSVSSAATETGEEEEVAVQTAIGTKNDSRETQIQTTTPTGDLPLATAAQKKCDQGFVAPPKEVAAETSEGLLLETTATAEAGGGKVENNNAPPREKTGDTGRGSNEAEGDVEVSYSDNGGDVDESGTEGPGPNLRLRAKKVARKPPSASTCGGQTPVETEASEEKAGDDEQREQDAANVATEASGSIQNPPDLAALMKRVMQPKPPVSVVPPKKSTRPSTTNKMSRRGRKRKASTALSPDRAAAKAKRGPNRKVAIPALPGPLRTSEGIPVRVAAIPALKGAYLERKRAKKNVATTASALKKAEKQLEEMKKQVEKARERSELAVTRYEKARKGVEMKELQQRCDWNDWYGQLLLYKERHGHCILSPRAVDNEAEELGLSKWCEEQRRTLHRVKPDGEGTTISGLRKAFLERLDFPWDADEDEVCWRKRVHELTLYKAEFGTANVPAIPKDEKFKPLAQWLVKIRAWQRNKLANTGRMRLSPRRQKQLEEVGVVFAPYGTWEERYRELLAFKEEHGHLNVPSNHGKLGSWLRRQLRLYHQRTACAPAGAIPDTSHDDSTAANPNDGEGNTVDPPNNTGETGRPKASKSPGLSDKRVQLLTEAGVEWEGPQAVNFARDPDEAKYGARWWRKYRELIAYRDEFGTCCIPSTIKDPTWKGLADWVSEQREYFKYGKEPKGPAGNKREGIAPERFRVLTEAGFNWAPNATKWHARYKSMIKYKEENGVWPHTGELGAWVRQLRNHYRYRNEGKTNSMTDEKVQLLNNIGFRWEPTNHGQILWEQRFQDLLQFRATHGHTNVPSKYPPNEALGHFVRNQRTAYKARFKERTKTGATPLTDERVATLEAIGFEWRVS